MIAFNIEQHLIKTIHFNTLDEAESFTKEEKKVFGREVSTFSNWEMIKNNIDGAFTTKVYDFSEVYSKSCR